VSDLRAPFSPDQVAALNDYQQAGWMHPFTCPNRGDGKHRTTTDLGILVATEAGWTCPDCDYTQGWAHSFMADPAAAPPARSADDPTTEE
jgi:hypothetical protein